MKAGWVTLPAPSPPAPPPRGGEGSEEGAGEGWGEGALRLGLSGCRQHFFQGLGGEHPLGPAQQGVGVGRFDALLDGGG